LPLLISAHLVIMWHFDSIEDVPRDWCLGLASAFHYWLNLRSRDNSDLHLLSGLLYGWWPTTQSFAWWQAKRMLLGGLGQAW
jgi:hypothetical protein